MVSSTASRTSNGTAHVYVELGGQKLPYLLAKDENGNIGWRPGWAPMLAPNVRQDGFNYQHLPPEVDITIPFDCWNVGAGYVESRAEPGPIRESGCQSYHYSRGIDASYPQRLYLSPKRQSAPREDNLPTGAPDYFADTSLGHYMSAGRYLYRYNLTTESYDEVADLGAGEAFTGPVVEFNGNLFAPAGDSEPYIYSTDGGDTWIASTLNDDNALKFAVRGYSSALPQLWKVDGSGNLKNNVAGTNDGSPVQWSAAVPTGHTSETVNSLIVANDLIWVFKKEGFYTYDGSGVDDIFKTQYLTDQNGKHAILGNDGFIYVPYGGRLMQLDPRSNQYGYVFPNTRGSEEINGDIYGITSDVDWIYVGLRNRTGNTYIMKGRDDTWHTYIFPFGDLDETNSFLTAENNVSIGTVAWANPTNILIDDTNFALADEDGTTNYLVGRGGFSIPSQATIKGVTLRLKRAAETVQLVDPFMEEIATVTLAAPAASVTFSGIDTAFRMFQLTGTLVRDGNSAGAGIVLNNDTGANYDRQRLLGNDTSVDAARATGETSARLFAGGSTTASNAATIEYFIGKQAAASPAMLVGGEVYIGVSVLRLNTNAFRWNNTADLISQISIVSAANDFAANTQISLNGDRSASV